MVMINSSILMKRVALSYVFAIRYNRTQESSRRQLGSPPFHIQSLLYCVRQSLENSSAHLCEGNTQDKSILALLSHTFNFVGPGTTLGSSPKSGSSSSVGPPEGRRPGEGTAPCSPFLLPQLTSFQAE